MEYGWIKIHRKILSNPIWTSGDCYLFQLWCYILLRVNHEEKKILFNKKELIIKKGEGIFGLNQIVKDCTGLNNENKPKFKKYKTIYYRKLKILESLGNLKLQPTNKFTIVKVKNWNRYQANETQLKLKRNSTETQVKTNKNDKNDKKKNIITYSPKSLKLAELLYKLIKENNPSWHVQPNWDRWAEDIDKIIRLDDRTVEQVEWMIKWVQADSFWRMNVLSPSKLREKFNDLIVRAKQNNKWTII